MNPTTAAVRARHGAALALLLLATLFVAGASGLRAGPAQAGNARAMTGPDLYIQDTPSDTGVEPNPDTGPMWVSQDIWVRQSPDPNWLPFPFPAGSPPWTPAPNQNPEYRDPKYGVPNYVYVRVRNTGTAASLGTEELHLNWAKASTGLSWPTQWADYVVGGKAYGMEATKPRLNAGTATPAQRTAYKNAIIAVAASPFLFFGGVDYWHKQQEIHNFGPANRHGTPAFLPWHRELLNRYEQLLEEADPTVRLLYWDWTTDPENTTGGTNLFTSSFMGASGRGLGVTSIGSPFLPALNPPGILRHLSSSVTPPANSDATLLGGALYQTFSSNIENVPNHNSAHGYIGGGALGSFPANGNISYIGLSAQDPFFFLLHGDVDAIWAEWQRNVANLSRLVPATAYDGYSSNVNITTSMAPWDGTGTTIQPYTIAGGYVVSKTPQDMSVVSPPVYDKAPVRIPVLQPGEAAVLQIPWYPPNPADFSSFGADQGHFCLVARIQTSPTSPFGMTFPETSDINLNTKNNNNIAWKNITVVDNFPGAAFVSSALIRNVFKTHVITGIHFTNVEQAGPTNFLDYGRITVDLKDLYERWVKGGSAGQGIKPAGGTLIEITSPQAFISNLDLGPDEVFPLEVHFTLNRGYASPRGFVPKWDVVQVGQPDKPDAVVGGQRFDIDFNRLVPVPAGGPWRYLTEAAPEGWQSPGFDDSSWQQGNASLGYGDNPVTTIDGGPPGKRRITTYFRRSFLFDDPFFFDTFFMKLRRDDGAVVYLNGKEIYRVNMPEGIIGPETPATRDVTGLERDVFFPVKLDPTEFDAGKNEIAVELHLASPASRDLAFDLELYGNPSSNLYPPSVAVTSPPNGALLHAGATTPVTAEAIDPDGKVGSVDFYADGKLIGTDSDAPYSVDWKGAIPGPHRLRVVATDDDQQTGLAEETVTVVKNVPPVATLTAPGDGTAFRPNKPIAAEATASDADGSVRKVEFHVRRMLLFTDPDKVVAQPSSPPYTATIRDLAEGMWMVTAVAVDDQGDRSPSYPAMIMVDGTAPVTTASLSPPAVNGWYVKPTLTLTATDGEDGSGVDMTEYSLDGGAFSPYVGALSGFASGGHTVRYRSTDMAGNVEKTKTLTFHVDATPPTVTITRPADGSQIPLGKKVTAAFRCADQLSGIASCDGSVKNGAPIDTSTVGAHTFKVFATDVAGNETTKIAQYQVVYTWNGFFSPVANTEAKELNLVHAGDLVRLGFSLDGDRGLNVLAYPPPERAPLVDCPSWAPHSVPAAGKGATTGLSFSTSSGHYQYGWQTAADWAGSCRRFELGLADGTATVHSATFMFFR